uniref:Uncharacterized protein n=1 Tax=Setaria italica TaxID=4555 RepID=K3YP35_SETIT
MMHQQPLLHVVRVLPGKKQSPTPFLANIIQSGFLFSELPLEIVGSRPFLRRCWRLRFQSRSLLLRQDPPIALPWTLPSAASTPRW